MKTAAVLILVKRSYI